MRVESSTIIYLIFYLHRRSSTQVLATTTAGRTGGLHQYLTNTMRACHYVCLQEYRVSIYRHKSIFKCTRLLLDDRCFSLRLSFQEERWHLFSASTPKVFYNTALQQLSEFWQKQRRRSGDLISRTTIMLWNDILNIWKAALTLGWVSLPISGCVPDVSMLVSLTESLH